ncbi:MAG: bifunctional phosphoribosyl-AMP cyclohydrolase/phosphoribosyl-ATP diphosphatase HisIE [Chloroflexota bacterium]
MTAGDAAIGPQFGPDGLIPVVVQDVSDGRVLMVAYADEEALAATLATGQVHFHSRSRGRLWRKGESSGHVLHLERLQLDCDGDAILVEVRPHGPTCHRGSRSCFDAIAAAPGAPTPSDRTAPEPQGLAWLETLWATIDERRSTRPSGSYTTALLDGGVDAVGRKVTEEAIEVLMAARDDAAAEVAGGPDRRATASALAGEAADLIYHTLVLLAERGLTARAVVEVLQGRHSPRQPPS